MAGLPQDEQVVIAVGLCWTDIGVGGLTDAVNGDTYSVLDILSEHCKSYKIYDVIRPKYTSFFNTLWFKTADANGDEIIPNSVDLKVEGTLSLDGTYVEWWERERPRLWSNITSNITASKNIFVDNPEAYTVGDVIRIVYEDVSGCTNEVYRNVTVIATGATAVDNYVTVDGANLTIDADAWNPKVFFLYHPYACNDTIVTNEQFATVVPKKSYFQFFAEKVCFTDNFINTCYSGMGALDSAVEAVDAKWEWVRRKLYTSVVSAFFFGEHKASGKPQTMGILKYIKDVDTAGTSIITDLSGATSIDQKILALMDELESVTSITEDITKLQVITNDIFMKNLRKANAAWGRITGCMKICDAGQNSVKSYGSLYDIELSNGVMVSFVSDAFLTHHYYENSVAIVAPVGYTAFYTHQNEIKDMNVAKKNGLFQWHEIQKDYALVVCETCYSVSFRLANVFVGVDSGLWRLILGF